MTDVPAAVRVLLSEHETARYRLTATAAALARGGSGEPKAEQTAIAHTWMLLAYLERGLEKHIAKEEGPLFPRLKAVLPADDRLIDEMVAEHDLVRIKRDDARVVLEEFTAAHDDVRQARAELRGALGNRPPIAALKEAVGAVADKLRIHIANEEELVFPLVAELSNADQIQVLEEMTGLDALG